jgi:GAF domain-containing protein
MENESLLETARRLREHLAPSDLDATLSQVTAASVDLLPNVQYSSITVLHSDGVLTTVAPTDPMIVRLDAEQYSLREGPCYDAATHDEQVVCSDLGADERFPSYGRIAVEMGIRSQIGVRLFDAPKSNGALNLYSTEVGVFEDLESLSALFAHQAGLAISYAHEIGTLREAVKSRTAIGTAVGIVMERYKLNDERAFAFLKRLSSHRNVKLRVVAQELVADAVVEDRAGPHA